jgi:UDPglucose 6-dehydrogenase
MHVTIVGAGYVGLTTAVAFGHLGHTVTAVEKDAAKLARLQRGESPIHEAGIDDLLAQVAPRLRFTGDMGEAVPAADIIVIAVGTPPKPNGEADLGYVEAAAREAAQAFAPGQVCTLVVKSTVPIGTNRRVVAIVERTLAERGVTAQVGFASNPEFLREGLALHDMFYPDRIVVGAESPEAIAQVSRLYRPILEQTFAPPARVPRPEGYGMPALVTTDLVSAEMSKYAANAFLALKISFINEVAGLCERVGADVTEVSRAIGLDRRIGPGFLQAGLGWGGSCFPKDTAALQAVAGDYGYAMPIIAASREVNARQRLVAVEKLLASLKVLRGRTVAVLGLAFKPGTDDVRDSPALDLVRALCERGAQVRVHDPIALPHARAALADLDVDFADDPYAAAMGADAVVLATEWDAYRAIDLGRLAGALKTPLLIDGRNLFNPDDARAAGLKYVGVGRCS